MKRKFLFTLLLLAAAVCSPARAMDVYVYINGSYVPVNVSENIYKIVFEDEYTHFITASGETATLRNEAFSFLTFRKLETPVGINAAKAEAVTITYENEGIRDKRKRAGQRKDYRHGRERNGRHNAPQRRHVLLAVRNAGRSVYCNSRRREKRNRKENNEKQVNPWQPT